MENIILPKPEFTLSEIEAERRERAQRGDVEYRDKLEQLFGWALSEAHFSRVAAAKILNCEHQWFNYMMRLFPGLRDACKLYGPGPGRTLKNPRPIGSGRNG